MSKIALAFICVVVLACYVVPYTLLSSVAAWYGAFLFWCVAGVAIIVLNVLATAGFGEDEA
ncbi:hypothetical protein [Mesorhizobium sp. RMAD-H1]|uniref:hypothetical protein n=1 Tax=Mesorhizobium sp. RMAD-H1 TaxID=2587065 RepID=UPI00161D33F5|nr:hypothetical protein [Mesorhizobium sp. RMAD-H1]MBB2973177.1 hypothetical protein [Mesorhizobium sp. RMAD-H1]